MNKYYRYIIVIAVAYLAQILFCYLENSLGGCIIAVLSGLFIIDLVFKDKSKYRLQTIYYFAHISGLLAVCASSYFLGFVNSFIIADIAIMLISMLFISLLFFLVINKGPQSRGFNSQALMVLGDIPFFSMIFYVSMLADGLNRILNMSTISEFPFIHAIVFAFVIYRIITCSLRYKAKMVMIQGDATKVGKKIIINLCLIFGVSIVFSLLYILSKQFLNTAPNGLIYFVAFSYIPYFMMICNPLSNGMNKDFINASFDDFNGEYTYDDTREPKSLVSDSENIIDADFEDVKKEND